jgi:hypothetical protein
MTLPCSRRVSVDVNACLPLYLSIPLFHFLNQMILAKYRTIFKLGVPKNMSSWSKGCLNFCVVEGKIYVLSGWNLSLILLTWRIW